MYVLVIIIKLMLYIYKYYLNLSMYKKTKGMIIDDF